MPRANLKAPLVQRQTMQQVAAQARDTAGQVATVVEAAAGLDEAVALIEGSVDGGLTTTLNYKLVNYEERLAALEAP